MHTVLTRCSERESLPLNMASGLKNWHSVQPSAHFPKIICSSERMGDAYQWTACQLNNVLTGNSIQTCTKQKNLNAGRIPRSNFGTGFCVNVHVNQVSSLDKVRSPWVLLMSLDSWRGTGLKLWSLLPFSNSWCAFCVNIFPKILVFSVFYFF